MRELRNLLERAVLLHREPALDAAAIETLLGSRFVAPPAAATPGDSVTAPIALPGAGSTSRRSSAI